MKIALITNTSIRHLYWVSELYKTNYISIILHVNSRVDFSIKKIKSKKPLIFGLFNFLLKSLSIFYKQISYYSFKKRINRAEDELLTNTLVDYEKIPKSVLNKIDNVNSSDTISFLQNNDIDLFSYPFGIRAKKQYEERLINEINKKFIFLGTINSLKNTSSNIQSWERGNLEFSGYDMRFRLFILPIFRKLFNKI